MYQPLWKVGGISLFILALCNDVLAGVERPVKNRKPVPRNEILERQVSGLKQELRDVRDQLATLEQKAGRAAPSTPAGPHPLPWQSRVAEDAKSIAILRKLEEPVSMSFANETPLEDVLKYIKSATQGQNDAGIPMYVDPEGLNQAEKTMTSPVTLDLEGVPLKTTLHLVLKQLGLTYKVIHGVLTISTESLMDNWPAAQLVELAVQGEFDPEQLQRLIEQVRAVGELRKAVDDLRKGSGGQTPSEPARK